MTRVIGIDLGTTNSSVAVKEERPEARGQGTWRRATDENNNAGQP